MSNALLVLTTIIGSPAILWLDGPIMQALVTGAAGVAVVSCTMRPGEAIFFVSFARPAALLAAVPALWMLIQVVPMGLFAHPIWASAQAALGHPILGSISIDVGAGALALGRYLTIVAIGFWTAAAAIDRQRAEHILFALVAATGLIALIMTAAKLFGFGDFRAAGPALMQATDSMVIGVIVAGAAMVRTLERYETRRANPGRSVTTLTATFAACAAAFTLCFGSLLALAPRSVLVPAGYGIGVVAAIVLIRRLDLGRWGIAGICASAIVVAAPVGAGYLGGAKQDFSFGFARPSPEALVSTTQRMLIDASFLGTGAGTFAAIAPIYHDIDDSASFTTASTMAAAAAIELGRPILWLLVLTAGGAIAILLRAALRRGRDSFYAAAGAGTLIALLLLIFTNAGLLGTAPAMLAAATLGLAFAQCKSRSVPQ